MSDSGKTGWDKAAIILQPVGGLLTALAVALLGILGSNYLEKNRSEEAKLRQHAESQETKLRLYTELMSRREQSDTALREDMFKSIVGTFLKAQDARWIARHQAIVAARDCEFIQDVSRARERRIGSQRDTIQSARIQRTAQREQIRRGTTNDRRAATTH